MWFKTQNIPGIVHNLALWKKNASVIFKYFFRSFSFFGSSISCKGLYVLLQAYAIGNKSLSAVWKVIGLMERKWFFCSSSLPINTFFYSPKAGKFLFLGAVRSNNSTAFFKYSLIFLNGHFGRGSSYSSLLFKILRAKSIKRESFNIPLFFTMCLVKSLLFICSLLEKWHHYIGVL